MAMYSFSVASFTAVASRSKEGQDDVWVIVTVAVGTRSGVAAWPVALAVQAGQGVVLPWSAGSEWVTEPYQAAAGDAGVATYTLVNLAGSGPQDQEGIVVSLQDSLGLAAATVGGAAAIEAAIRSQFGSAGELLAAPAVAAGSTDCRGLLGVYVAPFTTADTPGGEDVQTTDPMTLTGASPAACGTTPKSTVSFSIGRSPNLFSQSTPVTALVSGTGMVEVFAVGMDGLIRRNARVAHGGSFGAWQRVGSGTFSQSAALVALTGTPQRKDVFGIGTDGVIYHLKVTPEGGWEGWSAVSPLGMFLPDTPLSAISTGGVLMLAAVDGSGVAQSMTWKEDAVLSPWGPLGSMTFERRTPLLLMSHVDSLVEAFAVGPHGEDYHTSRANTAPAWGPWQVILSSTAPEPTSRRMCGLTFDVFSAPNVSTGLGMAWFRVDGNGAIFQSRWTQGTGWIPAFTLSLIRTIFAGPVSGVRVGDELVLFVVGSRGSVGVTYFGIPVPFNQDSGWGFSELPAGPVLAKDRAITAVALNSTHVDVFVVDRAGLVQHFPWNNAMVGGAWAVV